MKKSSRHGLFTLLIASLSLGSFGFAEAHSSPDCRAKREFFRLKKSGEWINYMKDGLYLEVTGTKFIGLQLAQNETRACLYGFTQSGLKDSGAFAVQTKFVCFDLGRYELNLKKEYCEEGEAGCEADPGGISVGIGNLNVAEPTGMDEGLSFAYPSVIKVDFHRPLRLPIDFGQGILGRELIDGPSGTL